MQSIDLVRWVFVRGRRCLQIWSQIASWYIFLTQIGIPRKWRWCIVGGWHII